MRMKPKMTIQQLMEVAEKYAVCPECGCEYVGNGKGTLEFDTSVGYFKRTCHCGWSVEIKDGDT